MSAPNPQPYSHVVRGCLLSGLLGLLLNQGGALAWESLETPSRWPGPGSSQVGPPSPSSAFPTFHL